MSLLPDHRALNVDVVHTDNKLVGLDWEVLQDLEFILEVSGKRHNTSFNTHHTLH
jgi:hypothetical protein